jgi:hypothetical protein
MDKLTPSSPNPVQLLKSLIGVLKDVVQRLREPPHVFVIGVSIIIVILVFGVLWIAPDVSGPLYAALIVIGILALAALAGGVITATAQKRSETAELPPSVESDATQQHQPAKSQEKTTVQEEETVEEETNVEQSLPPDCESLKRQLQMARKTLAALEVQEAGYTVLTMPAHLQLELEEQRRKVAELERRLAECIGREARQ